MHGGCGVHDLLLSETEASEIGLQLGNLDSGVLSSSTELLGLSSQGSHFVTGSTQYGCQYGTRLLELHIRLHRVANDFLESVDSTHHGGHGHHGWTKGCKGTTQPLSELTAQTACHLTIDIGEVGVECTNTTLQLLDACAHRSTNRRGLLHVG